MDYQVACEWWLLMVGMPYGMDVQAQACPSRGIRVQAQACPSAGRKKAEKVAEVKEQARRKVGDIKGRINALERRFS